MTTGKSTAANYRSDFVVPKMDCPSEERAVRTALEGVATVHGIAFDLPGRRLSVWHAPGAVNDISERLGRLGFGAQLVATERDDVPVTGLDDGVERTTLQALLAINGVMFVAEFVAGWLVQSTGLLADSLDMLADALVYGLGLYAVGRAARDKLRAARASGWLQLALALGAMFEVARRFLIGSEPDPLWMMGVAAIALAANIACLVLVARHRHGGAHMKASYIFSTNDVIANVGVIVAGVLVRLTTSSYPDLAVGGVIGAVVLSGAIRILRIRG